MTRSFSIVAVFALLAFAVPAEAQQSGDVTVRSESRSTGKALALNMVLPGLGHRYLNHGHWSRGATLHAAADVTSWLLLIDSSWRHNALSRDYQTFATAHAGVQLDGKSRQFLLDIGAYSSVDAFIEAQLRDRRWDRLGYADDPAFYWMWESEEARQQYREMRDDAERLRRRQPILITVLVGNRILAAVTTLVASRSDGPASQASIMLAPSPIDGVSPALNVGLRF